jgi:predicted AAA+ superfamily ATPase
MLPDAPRIDLLDEGLYQSFLREPGLFANELRTLPRRSTVVVDEIQRIPGLLNEVHRFIEDRQMRFVLLGSSARKLKQAGTNLLAGRALHRQMFPLLPRELGADFDLAEVLRHGSLPVIWTAPDRREALEAYGQMYLKEEIQAESLVRNLPGFARFLPVAAVFHGQVLSVAGLARDAGVARTTVEGYLGILADTPAECVAVDRAVGLAAELLAAAGIAVGNVAPPLGIVLEPVVVDRDGPVDVDVVVAVDVDVDVVTAPVETAP